MDKNVGAVELCLRALIVLVLIADAILSCFPAAGWNWVGWIGVVPLLTALVGFCPAYVVFGLSTCKNP